MFFVNVPVLSERRYYILPSSSVLLLFLTVTYGIYLSLFISIVYLSLAKSRLTLIEIGIIQLNSKNVLIKYIKKSFY